MCLPNGRTYVFFPIKTPITLLDPKRNSDAFALRVVFSAIAGHSRFAWLSPLKSSADPGVVNIEAILS